MVNTKEMKKVTTRLQKDVQQVQKYFAKVEEAIAKISTLVENSEVAVTSTSTVKRGPGRPRKTETATTTKVAKRGPGRPRKTDAVALTAGAKQLFDLEIQRIETNINGFNKWNKESTKEKEIWVIENGTYVAVIEGFFSSGNTGRYGVTTRLYVNPNSHLVPEALKGHIDTAAVNRIRYLETKADGLEYIEKQKAKLFNDYFQEVLPTIIANHGKKGSVYAFHLDSQIRKHFNQFKKYYDENYSQKFEKELSIT